MLEQQIRVRGCTCVCGGGGHGLRPECCDCDFDCWSSRLKCLGQHECRSECCEGATTALLDEPLVALCLSPQSEQEYMRENKRTAARTRSAAELAARVSAGSVECSVGRLEHIHASKPVETIGSLPSGLQRRGRQHGLMCCMRHFCRALFLSLAARSCKQVHAVVM